MTGEDIGQEIDLRGQVAIVTGAGRGLGRAYAEALARAGAAVAVVARSADQLAKVVSAIEQADGHAIAVTADVTDQQAIEHAVAETKRRLGSVDLLINNAGRLKALGELWELDPEQWWREIEVNLRSLFLCARAVLPDMVARRCGRIINLASNASLGPIEYGSAYVISKTATIRFSENLAAETKEHGISVFAIHPGTVRTPMNTYWVESGIAELPAPVAQRLEGFSKLFEEGRDTPIEQSVQLVLLLASGKADALSGCYVSVSDDLAEMVSRAEEIQEKELYTLRLRS